MLYKVNKRYRKNDIWLGVFSYIKAKIYEKLFSNKVRTTIYNRVSHKRMK